MVPLIGEVLWPRRLRPVSARWHSKGNRSAAAGQPSLGKPAILGGEKTRNEPFSSWPLVKENDEEAMAATLRSTRWFRGDEKALNVKKFEEDYAKLTGAKHCIATNSGTSALVASLGAMGDRAGRRGDRHALHVHRHDQRRS